MPWIGTLNSKDPDKDIRRGQVFANIKRHVTKLQGDEYLGLAIRERPNIVVEWACAELRKVDNTIGQEYADINSLNSFFEQLESRYAFAREDVAALEKLRKGRDIKNERDLRTAWDDFGRLSGVVIGRGSEKGMGPREILFRLYLSNLDLHEQVHVALMRAFDAERRAHGDQFDVDRIANAGAQVAMALAQTKSASKKSVKGSAGRQPSQPGQYQQQRRYGDDSTSGRQRYPEVTDAQWRQHKDKVLAMSDNPGADRAARNKEAGRLGVCGVCGGNTHFTNKCAKRKQLNH